MRQKALAVISLMGRVSVLAGVATTFSTLAIVT